MTRASARPAPPVRPVWVVVLVVALGSVAVSMVIAWAAVHYFYPFLLGAFLLGMAAAVFTALLADRLGHAGSGHAVSGHAVSGRIVAMAAGLWVLALFSLCWVFAWRLSLAGLPEPVTLAEFVTWNAETMTLMRRGRELFDLPGWGSWVIWTAEAGIGVWAAAFMAPKMHEAFREI